MRVLVYRNKKFENQLFRNNDFKEVEFTRCVFSNVKFDMVDLRGAIFRETVFENVNFVKTKLTYSSFAKTCMDQYAAKFHNVNFLKCNFNQISTNLTFFKNCVFESCNFTHTDFGGSVLENVKINGDIKSCFFVPYGEITRNGFLNGIFNRYKNVKTVYKNVDLSNARLEGIKLVDFDKQQIKLPEGPNYIYIANMSMTYISTRNKINNNWIGEDKLIGLKFLDALYKPEYNEVNAFIDSNYLKEGLYLKIFDLLKENSVSYD